MCDNSYLKDILQKAAEAGFSKAVPLPRLTLRHQAELRARCTPELCAGHGHNWVCPPGCGTLEQCAEKAREFHSGILLQSVTELQPPTDAERYKELNRAHNLRFRAFIEAVQPGLGKVLPLTSGGCVFCERCAYPDPCVKPDVKMESLSAFGIDVAALCEAAGLPFSFRSDRVYYTALLMMC